MPWRLANAAQFENPKSQENQPTQLAFLQKTNTSQDPVEQNYQWLTGIFNRGARLVGVADKKGSATTGPGGALSLPCFDQLAADFAGLANQLFNFLTLAPTDRALKAGQVFLHPPSHL